MTLLCLDNYARHPHSPFSGRGAWCEGDLQPGKACAISLPGCLCVGSDEEVENASCVA